MLIAYVNFKGFVRLVTTDTVASSDFPAIPPKLLEIAASAERSDPSYKLGVYKRFGDGSDLLTIVQTDGVKVSEGMRYLSGGEVVCRATIETNRLNRWLTSNGVDSEFIDYIVSRLTSKK